MLSFALLLFIPASLALRFLFNASPLLVFATSAVAVAVLADWVRRATEQLAERAGSTVGGLLNISFGSIAELVLALFVLASGQIQVVQAQITGSIIGTSLLGLGLAMFVGGLGRERQTFNRPNAGQLSTLLFLVVIAMLLPAAFDRAQRATASAAVVGITDEQFSLAVSAVLLVIYAANLVYTLVTHRDVFAADEQRGKPSGASPAPWRYWWAARQPSPSKQSWFRTLWLRLQRRLDYPPSSSG